MAVVTKSGVGWKPGIASTVRLALRQFGLVGSAARFLLVRDETRRFLARADSDAERKRRREILHRFDHIHGNVTCAHSPAQFVIMAEHVLSLDVPGDLVQCGVFKGGSAAKLSVLAKATGRRLYVCDSFQGLPNVEDSTRTLQGFGDQPSYVFGAGEYCGSLEEVKRNIARHGELGVCTFVEGWFSESLPKLAVNPALVFTDVDYISSARDCLRALWPKLQPGGYWFTHEAMFLQYLEGLMDPKWWSENLGDVPPMVVGAGSGLSAAAPSLAYFRKPTTR
jgi:O-methyltransferase